MKNLMMPWLKFLMDEAGGEGGGGQTGSEGGNKDGKGKDGKGGEGGEGNHSEDDDQGDDEGGEKVDLSKQPEAVQKLIKKLRTENAGFRTKNKEFSTKQAAMKKLLVEAGLAEDDSASPEEQVQALTSQTTALGVRNAILEACVEFGVGKDQRKYFEFLVNQELEALGEDDELSDDRLAEIAEEAKALKVSGGNARSTSVGSGKGKGGGQGAGAGAGNGQPPPEGGGDKAVTLEQFMKMNVLEKSALYKKDEQLYIRLRDEAKLKGKFI